MNVSHVSNQEAKFFLQIFFKDREINKEFYERVPDDQFDFRMTSKSDSVRESLGHQIGVQMDYMSALDTKKLEFKTGDDKQLKSLSKKEQLGKLDNLDEQLVEKLNSPNISTSFIIVPWSPAPIHAVSMLFGLRSHEVLHTGWNLAIMDHLNIPRFNAIKELWG